MDLNDIVKKFDEYVQQFDLTNEKINDKFNHSHRVMVLAKKIAVDEDLCDEDIFLASVNGLVHDISRFSQIKMYDDYSDSTYNKKKLFDHGNESERILKELKFLNEFIPDEELRNIVYIAARNHNKLCIEDNLSDRELLHSKIIRDADKLDIMLTQSNSLSKSFDKVDENILVAFRNKSLVLNKDIHCESDYLLRSLSYVFDLYFSYSIKFIKRHRIVQKKVKLLKSNTKDVYTINKIEYLVKKYLENWEDNYVR